MRKDIAKWDLRIIHFSTTVLLNYGRKSPVVIEAKRSHILQWYLPVCAERQALGRTSAIEVSAIHLKMTGESLVVLLKN